MACKNMKCENCKPHEFQDTKYGKNVRVFNSAGSKETLKWRCTCCGNEKSTVTDKKQALCGPLVQFGKTLVCLTGISGSNPLGIVKDIIRIL